MEAGPELVKLLGPNKGELEIYCRDWFPTQGLLLRHLRELLQVTLTEDELKKESHKMTKDYYGEEA